MTATDLDLRDMLRVEGDRYWSYLCASPLCCPPEGVPFAIEGHPAAVAFTVGSGQQILGGRDDLAATIAPVTGPMAEAMHRETLRAQRIAARLITCAATSDGPARPVLQHGLKAVQAAITTYRDGGTIELAGQFAWLSLALTSLWVRELCEHPIQGSLVGEHTRQDGVAAPHPGPQVRERAADRAAQTATDTNLITPLATPQPIAARTGHVPTGYHAAYPPAAALRLTFLMVAPGRPAATVTMLPAIAVLPAET